MRASHNRFYDALTAEADRKAGLYHRLMVRSLSFPVSRLFLRWGCTPNQATALGTALGVLAAGVAASGGPRTFVIAAVLLHAARVMDHVDGNLARALRSKKYAGKMLDGLVDVLVDGLFLIAVGVGLGGAAAIFAAFAAWCGLLGAYARFRYLHFHAEVPKAEVGADGLTAPDRSFSSPSLWLSLLERFDREVALGSFLVAGFVGRTDWWLFGVGSLRGLVGLMYLAGSTYLAVTRLNVLRSPVSAARSVSSLEAE